MKLSLQSVNPAIKIADDDDVGDDIDDDVENEINEEGKS